MPLCLLTTGVMGLLPEIAQSMAGSACPCVVFLGQRDVEFEK